MPSDPLKKENNAPTLEHLAVYEKNCRKMIRLWRERLKIVKREIAKRSQKGKR